jgi:hypothetical protein
MAMKASWFQGSGRVSNGLGTRETPRGPLVAQVQNEKSLSVAEGENMTGGERPHLREVRLALLQLEKD